jgi:hypothetical protein
MERQQRADERIPELLKIPAKVRFLSVEPMLGPIDLRPKAPGTYPLLGDLYASGIDSTRFPHAADRVLNCFPKIHWVICGGESGHHARPFDLAWARSLRDQCKAAGVAYFMKQMGSEPGSAIKEDQPHQFNFGCYWHNPTTRVSKLVLHDKKGGETDEWPEDLRIREFPGVTL